MRYTPIRVLRSASTIQGQSPTPPVSVAGVIPPISTTSPECAVNDTPGRDIARSSPDDQLTSCQSEQRLNNAGVRSRVRRPFMAPFASQLTATRELSERQAVQLRDQAELIGRLSSDLDRARTIVKEPGAAKRNADLTHRVTWAPRGVGIVIVAATSAALAWSFAPTRPSLSLRLARGREVPGRCRQACSARHATHGAR